MTDTIMRLTTGASSFTAASPDRNFISRFKSNFGGLGADPELLLYVFFLLLFIVLLFMLGRRWNKHQAERKGERPPFDHVTNEQAIVANLQAAVNQRAKVEFKYEDDNNGRVTTSCSILDVALDKITLEGSAYLKIGKNRIGRKTECNLRIRSLDHSGRNEFYAFTSTIRDIQQHEMGTLIVLDFPETFVRSQKRRHFRIEPPSKYIQGVAIWEADSSGRDADNPKAWGKPDIFIKQNEVRSGTLSNLSAGGVRLTITKNSLKEKNVVFDIGKKFYIWVLLLEPTEDAERPEKLKFWFKCVVRNIFEDTDCRCMTIGMKFESSGLCTHKEGDELVTWKAIPDGGYEPLSNWIAKLHLDMLRSVQREEDLGNR